MYVVAVFDDIHGPVIQIPLFPSFPKMMYSPCNVKGRNSLGNAVVGSLEGV